MFNENLKILRKSKGFTQEELAIKVNVVRQTVSKWEKGLSVPDAEVLQKIAEVLDVGVNELLGANMAQDVNKNEIELADLVINPKIGNTSLIDFNKSRALANEGYKEAKKLMPQIKELLALFVF